jgi:Phosphodiester glycosidase
MQKWLRRGALTGLGFLLGACSQALPFTSSPTPTASLPSPEPAKIEYKVKALPHSIVHTLTIPAKSDYTVVPEVAQGVETLDSFAQKSGAIAVINGGFFDPNNQKSTSSVIGQGRQLALPEDNDRLMNNPDLLPYLDKILNRSELRRYRCGAISRYDVTLRQAAPPGDCQLEYSLGAGPQLLPTLLLEEEGFLATQGNTVIRDALGSRKRNARSAVGITAEGGLVWVMVAQKPDSPQASGMTLAELADFLKSLKVEKAINLDGGSSSALYYNGETLLGKRDELGQAIERPVKSALMVMAKQKSAQK